MLARRLSPQELVDLAVEVWPHVWEQIPPEQRVPFLTEAATNNLGIFMMGLSRHERIALLNALLPISAREFPLAEADFLTAFASPGDRYAPQALSEE
jgi:hypothetical protein